MTNNKKELTVAAGIKNRMPSYSELLKTSGTDIAKFENNAVRAIHKHPEIGAGKVSQSSVFEVCSQAANDGVVLDGKEAALILGSKKVNGEWVKEAQYRLMAGGAMKMINRSPNIERIVCQLIHENDDFEVDFVTGAESISHRITPASLKKGRGEVVGVYFTAKLASGEWSSPEIMSVDEVNEVRDNFSKKDKNGNYTGMWAKSWGEAARKTILHRARKRLPLESSIEESLEKDMIEDSEVEFVDNETGEVFESQEEMQAAEQPKPKKKKAADKVKEAVKDITPQESENPADAIDAEFTEIDEEEIPV